MGNLSEAVYQKLSENILNWNYLPGHRLTEEHLCKEFSVSRSPVREALTKLVENGLITKKPATGYHVKLPDFEEIEELYEVRLAIEEYVVRRLCRDPANRMYFDRLEEKWKSLKTGLPESLALIPAADEKFHEKLAELIGNRSLSRMLKNVDKRIHFVRVADIINVERSLATCDEHLEILEALREQKLDKALESLRLNIGQGMASAVRAVKEALSRAYLNPVS